MLTHLGILVLALLELAPAHGFATALADFGDPLRWALFGAGLAGFAVVAIAAALLAALSPSTLAGPGTPPNPRLNESALRDQVEDVIALQAAGDDTE